MGDDRLGEHLAGGPLPVRGAGDRQLAALGGCVIIEAAAVPVLMALADAVLVAWVLVELRNAGPGRPGPEASTWSGWPW